MKTPAERQRDWRKRHPEKAKAQGRKSADAWRKKNPAKLRDYRLRSEYGITTAERDALMVQQGGVCALCGDKPPEKGRDRNLSLDHCHATGRIRGLLCRKCNVGLGMLGDTVEKLQRAIQYLCLGHGGEDGIRTTTGICTRPIPREILRDERTDRAGVPSDC